MKFILALLILLTIVNGQFQPFCELNPYETEYQLYAEQGEQFSYWMNQLFRGFNLTFDFGELLPHSEPNKNFGSITQRAQSISYEVLDEDTILAHAQILESNGTGLFSLLVRDNTDNFYDIKVGSGKVTTAPSYNQVIQLPHDDNTECFDMTQLSETIIVVDCFRFHPGQPKPYQNYFYIVNTSDPNNMTQQELPTYTATGPILNRKTRSYSVLNTQYVVSGVTFDNLVFNQSSNATYMWIYTYTTSPADPKYPQGYLTYTFQIDAEKLGLQSGTLQMIDFAILGGRVYLLDHKQGLFTFLWDGQKLSELVKFDLQAQNIPFAWGLSVNLDGGFIQIVIAGDSSIFSFRLETINSELQLLAIYNLGVESLVSRVIMQSNSQFITVRLGQMMNVYRRFVTDPNEVWWIFQDVQQSQLFYAQTLYVFTSSSLNVYALQEPSFDLKVDDIQPKVDQYFFAISTWLDQKVICQAMIESHRLPRGSTGIYFTNIQAPPDRDYYVENNTAYHIPLDITYIGPNLHYSNYIGSTFDDASNDAFSMHLDQPGVTTLTMVNPEPEKWFISKIVAMSDISFYQIHQDFNLVLSFHFCTTDYADVQTVTCQTPSQVTLDSAISAYDHGTWAGGLPCIALVTIMQRESVQVYYLNGQKNSTIDIHQNVTSIALGADQLFITTDEDTVEVFQYVNGTETRIFNIDKQMASTWPLVVDDWSPKQVLTTPSINGTIFVRLSHSIVIVSIQFIPLWLNNIPLKIPQNGTTTDVFVNRQALIVVYSDDEIIEYNLQFLADPNIATPMQTFNLYDRFTLVRNTASMSPTGRLYVMANDKLTQTLVILIFRTYFPAVNTLYKVVDLGETSINNQLPVTVAAGGRGFADYIYVSLNGKENVIRAPWYPQAIFYPNDAFPKLAYTNVVKFGIQIDSIDNQTTPVQLIQRGIFVNQQKTVNTNTDVISQSHIQNIEYKQNTDSYTFDVSNWFFGPYLQLQLSCDQCGDNIKIKNRVNHHSVKTINNIVDSFSDHVTDSIYVLGDDLNVYVYDYNFNKLRQIKLLFSDTETPATCSELVPAYDSTHQVLNYTLAICKQGGQFYVAPIWFGTDKPKAVPALLIEELLIFVHSQFSDGKLLILNEDKYNGSAIYVYNLQLNIDINATQLSVAQIYNKDTLNLKGLDITAFQVSSTDHASTRKIFLTNQTDYVYFLNINSTDYSVIHWDYFWLKQRIANEDLFILQNTTINSIRVVYFSFDPQATYFFYRAIIVTSNTAIYEIQLVFNTSQDDQPKPLLDSNIIGVFQNYGTNSPLNKVQVYGEYITMAYYNKNKNSASVVVYHRDTGTQLIKKKVGVVPPMQQILGGWQFDKVVAIGGLPSLSYVLFDDRNVNPPQPKLLVVDPNQVNQAHIFDLNPVNITITSGNRQNVKKQSFNLSPQSDFSDDSNKITGQFSYDGPQPAPPKPDDKNSTTTIIIVVCVIAGVGLLGGLGFYFYRKRKMALTPKEDGYSLQEQ